MNIVILGSGFVSQGYQLAIGHLGYAPIVLSRHHVDYTDPSVLRPILEKQKAHAVINCAGFTGTSVDECETNKAECFRANVTLALNVAETCADLKIPLLHISSGCIFSSKSEVFTEDSEPNPVSWYAECKALSEEYMGRLEGDRWIFRIRMPYTFTVHPRNWLTKLCAYSRILNGLNSVTFLDEFCMRSWQVMGKAPAGIYNCVQPGPVYTEDVAGLLQQKGLRGPFTLWNESEFLKAHVRRSEAVLSCEKFENAYKSPSTSALSSITWCADQMKTPYPYEA